VKKRTGVLHGIWQAICQTIGQIGIPFIPFMYSTGDFWDDVFINGVISCVIAIITHYAFSKKGQKAIKKFYNQIMH